MTGQVDAYTPTHAVRAVTAASLFDGHDASINIMRRILQDTGVEVIHLGHNRSVSEIARAAIDEDAQGIAVSSYQGGHIEFFKFLVDSLKQQEMGHIKVFGGGGGVIIPEEIRVLQAYGVDKIFSPKDGAELGLQGMINRMVRRIDFSTAAYHQANPEHLFPLLTDASRRCISGLISALEAGDATPAEEVMVQAADQEPSPVVGITGTGGAGKSSLTDEIVLRFLSDFEASRVAVLSCDPSKRKTGGALLGDRIRMNSLDSSRVYMRSMATRGAQSEVPDALPDTLSLLRALGFDLVIVETAGIGQGDSSIVDLVDLAVYVMTGEFGAASQLEKIDMLDYADIVVINKFEKQGAEDALRNVQKQVQRNRRAFDTSPNRMPVYGTIASAFNDGGVTAFYHAMLSALAEKTGVELKSNIPAVKQKTPPAEPAIIPSNRVRYLSEISEAVRKYHKQTETQAQILRRRWHLVQAADAIRSNPKSRDGAVLERLNSEVQTTEDSLHAETTQLVDDWGRIASAYSADDLVYSVRDREYRVPLFAQTESGTRLPKVALPRIEDPGQLFKWLREENLPGRFPFTAGVFPVKREDEEPTRMFAGEGGPERTNRRFQLLSAGSAAKRLSTAFDSVTLYGCDPERRPDIYGKVGTSGVSICSLEDMKLLYGGFDLCAPRTSVSMTINGPAPIILAMFLNTAIDQQVSRYRREHGRPPDNTEWKRIKASTLATVRGTVQADILKEDQGQNTCIFSIEFAMKMMGDIQQYFIDHHIRNFYSVSVSGYHIAEAGANPITQLAFTLANGFTYVEYYRSRGMEIDRFAPNFSFFFSNGMDAEYTVIGRVARRIWSIAMKQMYDADSLSQRLKYHVQTSGRSLHGQAIELNDIRTTLQALCAVYDNCNSLHTNASDEAITTPSPESVRRALAIQLIINREWGLSKNQNMNQGSFVIEELTRLVEEAVLAEFDRITARGGVLGAMESGYQRSRIQEESIRYESMKQTGERPIVGVNAFVNPNDRMPDTTSGLALARASDAEKESQLRRLASFKKRNEKDAPGALEALTKAALAGDNIFAALMDTVRFCTLGQITQALYRIGGKYRRSM